MWLEPYLYWPKNLIDLVNQESQFFMADPWMPRMHIPTLLFRTAMVSLSVGARGVREDLTEYFVQGIPVFRANSNFLLRSFLLVGAEPPSREHK
jgi:hypothetical protein